MRSLAVNLLVLPFQPEHLPAVRRMAEAVYPRPRSDAYFRWAYLEDPSHRAWLALEDGRCVALLRAFARPYRLGDAEVTCLETFDWYSAPEARRSAAGLRVMRAAMDEPQPLVNVGGTADTLAILPRLGWRTIDGATSYVLPLSGRALPPELAARMGPAKPVGRAALALGSRAWFGRGRGHAPAGGTAVPLTCPGDEVRELYEGGLAYATVPVADPAHLRWLASGFSGAGQFLSLLFRVRGALRGWGMARVYVGPDGPEASLVEVYAPRPDAALYRWMVAALVARVRPYRPVLVRAQATCPVLGAALRRQRFLRAQSRPVQMWSAAGPLGARPTHFTMSTQDFPMLPYAEGWEDPGPSATSAQAATTEAARVH